MLSVFECVLEEYHPMFMKIKHRVVGGVGRGRTQGTKPWHFYSFFCNSSHLCQGNCRMKSECAFIAKKLIS
jgi:hypothetical protein